MFEDTAGGARAPMGASANDRLKAGWHDRFWSSMIAAVLVHFAVLQGWPTMTAAEIASSVDALETIELPEVDLPPAPEEIVRPAAPVVARTDVSADVTITRLDWEAPTQAPPPPSSAGVDDTAGSGVGFTPFTVAPTITNRDEVAQALDREYPSILKNAGIGGVVRVAFHIDERGRVLDTRVDESSGYEGLDTAAEKVADVMRFTPALNRENAVAVWVVFPIRFQVR